MYEILNAGTQFHRQLALDAFRETPRLGRTNNFADLFNDDKRAEYLNGVLVIALILECIFLSWAIFLCFLKCMGKQRVGFLSGAPYDASIDGNVRVENPRPMRGRIVFGVSGMIFITFTFLLIFLGIGGLEETTQELSTGASLGSDIFVDSRSLLNEFIDVAVKATTARDTAVDALERVFETGDIAQTVANNTNFTLSPAQKASTRYVIGEINFQERAAEMVEKLYALDDLIHGQSTELNNVLGTGEHKLNEVSNGLDDVQVRALQILYGVPYTVVPALMLLLMVLTAMGVNNSGKDWCTSLCFVPFFIILVMLLILFTGAYAVGGIMNADFCSGGPDHNAAGTIIAIMDNKGIASDSVQYIAVQYLVNGCQFDTPEDEQPLRFMDVFEAKLNGAQDSMKNFTTDVDVVGVERLRQLVGSDDFDVVQEATRVMEEQVVRLATLIRSVFTVLACHRLYEIYVVVADQATCDKTYTGLVWCFSSFLVMSLCGMLMITFRAVLYPLAGEESDDYSWNEVKGQEGINQGANNGIPDEVVGTNPYEQDEGIKNSNAQATSPAEAPMGGKAQRAYDAVGDDNPFADKAGNDEVQM